MASTEEIKAEIKRAIAAGERINRIQNENADGYDHTDWSKIEKLTAELNTISDLEWTPDVTASRKKAWNEYVSAIANGRREMPVKEIIRAYKSAEKELGFTLEILKKYVAKYAA